MREREIVVVTGASGRIGTAVVPLLRRNGRELRLVDTAEPSAAEPGEWRDLSIDDATGLRDALSGARAVIHLAGIASEAPWGDLLRVNVDGTRILLEAARDAGVGAVLLASSVHAAGFHVPDRVGEAEPLLPRPDTYYGVTKAAMEALGSLFSDRFGMSIVSARICTFLETPDPGRAAASWLSPGDAARLFEAAIALADGRHHIVWGVSRNAPGWFPLGAGEEIGYRPQDDAMAELHRLGVSVPDPDPTDPIGGPFTRPDHPIGTRW
ncbi:NAD(P)-dependent oxidoreductase [Microbacterium barkeri]|uniref:NAD-dependent epimerase/dehydratase family protein n=1 Tax=Microbacterium barkeri TaxID=33917 RepID=UPI0024AF7D3E|nr:NAD(P)-dependent oxidoreductase [Microbacterium barkeri]MDI6943467.1 NAD(P)-dependent oxidoreductase [Microbacterium barkeri]